MFCRYCGKEIPEDAVFCPYCGNGLNGQSHSQQFHINIGQIYAKANDLPMNWYNFLIYVGLFFAVIIHAYQGFAYLFVLDGSYFSIAGYSEITALNVIMGIAQLILAVFSFSVRQKLAHFKADGPRMLLILYIMNCAVTVVYVGLLLILLNQDGLFLVSAIPGCGVSAIMVYVNKVYFEKRLHLFVN